MSTIVCGQERAQSVIEIDAPNPDMGLPFLWGWLNRPRACQRVDGICGRAAGYLVWSRLVRRWRRQVLEDATRLRADATQRDVFHGIGADADAGTAVVQINTDTHSAAMDALQSGPQIMNVVLGYHGVRLGRVRIDTSAVL